MKAECDDPTSDGIKLAHIISSGIVIWGNWEKWGRGIREEDEMQEEQGLTAWAK